MITVLTGQDSVRLERELQSIKANFDGQAEVIDGADITADSLSDLSQGLSLFSQQRMVVIRRLSDSKLWPDIDNWLDNLQSSDSEFVLVEPNLDKRTKVYKQLQKIAQFKQFAAIDQRRPAEAYQYVAAEAKYQQLQLSAGQQRLIADLTGADSAAIAQAITKLALYDDISDDLIKQLIDPTPEQNTFRLFELALQKNIPQMRQLLSDLSLQQEAQMVFGALTYQATAFVAIVLSGGAPLQQIAADFGLSEYSLRNLAGYSHGWSRSQAVQLLQRFRDTDQQMKSSSSSDWTMIEKLLTEVCQI